MRVISAHEHGRGLAGKFALALLCLVVLELVLIGHQVQSVKALKKKIYLKKLKKILPFLALVKPKKKLILVPIPIPMYNNQQPYAPNYQGHHHPNMHTMNGEGSSPPVSFMMMTNEPNMMSGPSIGRPPSFELAPVPEPTANMMTMPSMTMTIQSDGTGTMSAIELNASSRPVSSGSAASSLSPSNNTVSGALLAGQPSKWHEQQQLQQYDYDLDEQFLSGGNLINEPSQQAAHPQQQQQADAGGEHYYSSPWQSSSRPPPQLLASPAEYLRKERLRQQQPPTQQQQQRHAAAQTVTKPRQQRNQHTIVVNPTTGGRLTNQRQQQQQQRPGKQRQSQRFSAPMPVLIVKNQWQPSTAVSVQQQQQQQAKSGSQNERVQQERHLEEPRSHMPPQLTREQEQQISRALEQESLVQVGPARMLPVYQSPSGRLSMTPPPAALSPRVSPPSTSATTVGSVASTSQDTPGGGNSFDDHETSASPTQADHSNAEVQTIGSSSGGSTSFFHSPAVGDTPTATEYSAAMGGSPSSSINQGIDGRQQHDAASEPTTVSSNGGSWRETVTATTAPATTSAPVAFMSSGRLVSPAVKGSGRIQSPPPPPPQQQPLGDGTKNNQAGALDSSNY